MATFKGYSLNETIARTLECNICLDSLKNPKMLHCGHAFCKCCLDGMLQFRADSSAIITCPLRCAGHTEINKESTTNILIAPIQFKNLMDMVGQGCEVSEQIKCSGSQTCKQTSAYYCCTCTAILCMSCKTKHHHAIVRYVPIRTYNGELHPWCAKHDTIARYHCQCGFSCLYCTKRDCAKHLCRSISELSQQIIKLVQNQGSTKYKSEKVDGIKAISEIEFGVIKDKISSELNKRKLNCLWRTLKDIDADEQRIFHDLDRLKQSHMEKFPTSSSSDNIIKRRPFEVILNKETLIQKLSSTNDLIPQMTICLAEYTMKEFHPLGEIVGNHYTGRKVDDCRLATSVVNEVKESDLSEDVKPSLLDGLEELFQQAFGRIGANNEPTGRDTNTYTAQGENKITGVTSGKQCYRVEKRKEMITKDIPQYAWTKGEPTTYQVEVEVEDIIPYESAYGDGQKVKQALNKMDVEGWKFLWKLCKMKCEDLFIELIKLRETKIFEEHDDQGNGPLHWSAMSGCVKLMLYILQNASVDVDFMGVYNNDTPLQRAAFHNESGCVGVLLAYGANLYLKNKAGTALDIARNQKHGEVVKLLEEAQKQKHWEP